MDRSRPKDQDKKTCPVKILAISPFSTSFWDDSENKRDPLTERIPSLFHEQCFGTAKTPSWILEFANRHVVMDVRQLLQRFVFEVFADEPHGAIAHDEMGPT